MQLINRTPLAVQLLPTQITSKRFVLLVLIKATLRLRANQNAVIAEAQLPLIFGDEFNDPEKGGSVKFESDIAPFKPRADIALVGHAYAPGGKPVANMRAALRIGEIKKDVIVIGDRHWLNQGGLAVASKPKPFTRMPLIYERAFGGIDEDNGGVCQENPFGRGFTADKVKKVRDGLPLPNIEDVNRVISSWTDRPRPAGFGFWGKSWQPRAKYLGTYDEKWQEERAPDPPADFRSDFYNAAHPDLQIKGYLRGDELIEMAGLTPGGQLRSRLPGLQPVATVNGAEPLKLRLDTLCLIPDELRCYLLWRGFVPVADITAAEVREVAVALG